MQHFNFAQVNPQPSVETKIDQVKSIGPLEVFLFFMAFLAVLALKR